MMHNSCSSCVRQRLPSTSKSAWCCCLHSISVWLPSSSLLLWSPLKVACWFSIFQWDRKCSCSQKWDTPEFLENFPLKTFILFLLEPKIENEKKWADNIIYMIISQDMNFVSKIIPFIDNENQSAFVIVLTVKITLYRCYLCLNYSWANISTQKQAPNRES